MKQYQKIIVTISTFTLFACANNYPCNNPAPGRCASTTEAYNASLKGTLNPEDFSNNKDFVKGKCTNCDSSSDSNTSANTTYKGNNYYQVPTTGQPIRSHIDVLRVWYAPYEDSDHIYHDQNYAYFVANWGQWSFAANKDIINHSSMQPSKPIQLYYENSSDSSSNVPAPAPLTTSKPFDPQKVLDSVNLNQAQTTMSGLPGSSWGNATAKPGTTPSSVTP